MNDEQKAKLRADIEMKLAYLNDPAHQAKLSPSNIDWIGKLTRWFEAKQFLTPDQMVVLNDNYERSVKWHTKPPVDGATASAS